MSSPRPAIVYQLRWDRRNGVCPGEEVLGEAAIPHGPCPAWLLALWAPGTGYVIGVVTPPSAPVKRWSPERKARARRQALERRLQHRAPLFAAEIIEAELARRPGYFAGLDVEGRAT